MFETLASEVIRKIKRQILNNSRWENTYVCTAVSLVDRIFYVKRAAMYTHPLF